MSRNERNFAEALQPRPVAILLDTTVVAIDKISHWRKSGHDTTLIVVMDRGSEIYLNDPDQRAENKLCDLFRVVTP